MAFPSTTFVDNVTVIEADWLNAVNAACQTVTNVQDFGAVGNGITDDWQAIKDAVTAVNLTGGQLYFPPGTYYTAPKTTTVDANWIEITKSGVSFVAVPGSVTLENFLFYVHGSYGTAQIVGSAGFTSGDTQINTATAHNLAVGDYVQLLSSVNAGSTDAGVWQMESVNPTTLAPGLMRLSEIQKVSVINSSTTASIYGAVIYPDYKDNTSGYSYPLPGVTGAQVRKLTMIDGVKFSGLTFKNTTQSSFKCITARAAANLKFEDCGFIAAGLTGQQFKCTDSVNIYFNRCKSFRNPIGASGSSWNSFTPAGGTCGIWFTDCHFEGEQQTIDTTPLPLDTDIGHTQANSDVTAIQRTVQNLNVENSTFVNCVNAFTTHPGTYNTTAVGNKAFNCSTAFGLRGLKNTIVGNYLEGLSVGIAISAFYNDTLIADNEILDINGSVLWTGVSINPMSSETMNNNNMKNVVVQNNSMSASYATGSRHGVQIRQYGNGVPPAGFTGFTDAIKIGYSDYRITGNKIFNCDLAIDAYINGAFVKDNVFSGAQSGLAQYLLLGTYSAAAYVESNVFLDDLTDAMNVGALNGTLTYPYENKHSIGQNIAKAASTSIFTAGTTLSDYLVNNKFTTAYPASGTYTPTITLGTNAASANAYLCLYSVVGNVCSVSGQIRITSTATGSTRVDVSLPVASTFTDFKEAAGVYASQSSVDTGAIQADTTPSQLIFTHIASSTSATVFKFTVSYLIN